MRTAQLHLQRSTEALLGYLHYIACDDHLTNTEIANLQRWLETHHALRNNYPFDEISARLESILRDSVIDEDERAELLEWCADLSLDSHPVYDLIDRTTRQLHGVLHGIQSDGIVTEEEVYGLRDWLEHFHIFRNASPFSDAFALVDQILEDNHVSAEELNQLHTFCKQFSERPTHLGTSAPSFATRCSISARPALGRTAKRMARRTGLQIRRVMGSGPSDTRRPSFNNLDSGAQVISTEDGVPTVEISKFCAHIQLL